MYTNLQESFNMNYCNVVKKDTEAYMDYFQSRTKKRGETWYFRKEFPFIVDKN